MNASKEETRQDFTWGQRYGVQEPEQGELKSVCDPQVVKGSLTIHWATFSEGTDRFDQSSRAHWMICDSRMLRVFLSCISLPKL